MRHDVRRLADAEDVAIAAATFIATLARRAVTDHGACAIALSGGRTPRPTFAALASCDVPWRATTFYQVDERVVAPTDPARNLLALREDLATVPVAWVTMPVDDPDLERAAERYGAQLPERFDLVHLGLGADGHTASLVPGDPALAVRDRLVSVTAIYQGHRRMTLTYRALARADQLLWIVTGADKAHPLAQLINGDDTIPASHVTARHSVIMADAAAGGEPAWPEVVGP